MKIIISPSKTKQLQNSTYLDSKELLYPSKTKKIVATLRKFKLNEIARIMNIKGDMLKDVYHNIKGYYTLQRFHAFPSFNGLVFKNLKIDEYKESEYDYISKHLVILDAFYGVLEPGTLIKDYRLDFKMNIGFNLYNHWNIDQFFDDVIINLASSEYSKMIKNKPMLTISFLQQKGDKYLNQATFSKMARGLFLDFMIRNKITDTNALKTFREDGYTFNPELSEESEYIFTRKTA